MQMPVRLISTGVRHGAVTAMVALVAFSAPAMAGSVSCPPPNASTFVEPTGINDLGTVVGSCVNSSSQTISFTDAAGAYTILSDPSASANQTYATGINNSGTVAGYYANATGFHGFTESGGTYSSIDVVAGGTIAYGINNSGVVAGQLVVGTSLIQGFVDKAGVITYISDPNAPLNTSAFGINDSNDVVGTYKTAAGTSSFFATPTGSTYSYTTLADPLAEPGTTSAVGLNNAGDVVGYYTDSSGHLQGFVYEDGVYYTQSGGDPNTQTFSINNNGQLTGVTYTTPTSVGGYTAPATTTVPVSEPASWGFLLLGLLATVGVTWRVRVRAPTLKAA